MIRHPNPIMNRDTHQPSPVHRQQRTIHIPSTGTGQQQDGSNHLLGTTGTTCSTSQRCLFGLMIDVVFVFAGSDTGHFGWEDAGADGVDTNFHSN